MGAKKKARMRKKHKGGKSFGPGCQYGPDGNYNHLRPHLNPPTPYLDSEPMPHIRPLGPAGQSYGVYVPDFEMDKPDFEMYKDGYEPVVRGHNRVHKERVLEVGWFLLSTGGWVTFGSVPKRCIKSAVQEFEKYDDYIAAYVEGSFWDGYTVTGYFYTHDDAQKAGRAISNMWDIDLVRMPSEPPLPPRPPRPQIIRC